MFLLYFSFCFNKCTKLFERFKKPFKQLVRELVPLSEDTTDTMSDPSGESYDVFRAFLGR